jgi:hypothetical protein
MKASNINSVPVDKITATIWEKVDDTQVDLDK